MNCKYCNAQLEEQNLICPECGKDNGEQEQPEKTAVTEDTEEVLEETIQEAEQEEQPETEETEAEEESETEKEPEEKAPKKKKKSGKKMTKRSKTVLAVVLSAVLLLSAVTFGWWLYNGKSLLPKENNISFKDNYTAGSLWLNWTKDDVVATMGDAVLTNEELQVYYWMQVYNFLEYYGSSVNIDVSKPFAKQMMSSTTSWEQYFLELALTTWTRYQTLCMEAVRQNYTLPEEVQKALQETVDNLEESAKQYNFESAEAMIKADLGPGCTLDAYVKYIKDYYLSVHFFEEIYNQTNPTDDEVSKFFDEHADEFKTQYGVTKTSGKLVDVRHILLVPEGAQAGANGTVTATDDQWEACRVKAQAMLDGWKAGDATEEAFAALANTHSKDSGSNKNGGLYTQVSSGDMVESFDAWLFAEGRQPKDTGLVKTDFGYHIMYYVGGEEGWLIYGKDALISELCSQKLDDMTKANPIEVDYRAIVLGQADLTSNMK